MLNIDSGEQVEALYKLYNIKGGKKEEKFQTSDINEAIHFQQEFAKKYQMGLYMEILPVKKGYNRNKKAAT